MTSLITARLSLAVRLVDTTTGREVQESNTSFFIDGNLVHPMRKGEGTYVFVNRGRDDFLMQIKVYGFMDEDVSVRYETLDQNLPILDVFLIPTERNPAGGTAIQINGTLSGLEFIQAIDLNHPEAAFQTVSTKKEVTKMTVLPITMGGGVTLDSMAYAMLTKDQKRYEVFTVKEQDSATSVLLEAPLKYEHELNDRIFRIIYGRAGPKGKFLLKVRDNSRNLNFLLYFKVDGEEYLRPIDFHLEAGKINLRKGAIKITDLKEDSDNSEEIEKKEET